VVDSDWIVKREAAQLPSGFLASESDAERLSLALAAAHLGDWIWDARTDVVTFSPRAAEIFGIPAGPHMTWTEMRELLHPDDRERARLAVEQANLAHKDYAIEYRLINNGGRERWVSASGRARYGPSGEVLGMFGVVQNITNDRFLVRVDDEVRRLVSSEDITYTAARVLGQHLDADRCAYAFVESDEDTFGLSGNYTNHGVQSVVGRYRFRQFGAEVLRLMRAGEPYIVEDSETDPRIDAHDRESYRMLALRAVICVPITKAGRFVAAMAVHMCTPRSWSPFEIELLQQVASRCWESIERARVEREREALLHAAQAANRTKDEFLAMLGHELRNPLAPIRTALELMKLRGDAAFERERTVIDRQVMHLTRLVDDLLDVSRIARGGVVLKSEPVEIAEVVARALEVASPLLEERAHTLAIAVPPKGLAVTGDVARLTQVVSNLLTNAGKYTRPGGRIEIEAERDRDDVVLHVRDNGVGMAPEILPLVFDLFVQGQQTIDRAQGGLGLGLTIVKNLVERHGGTVTAHSEGPGKGSELVVRLPSAASDAAPASVPGRSRQVQGSWAGRRALVVDDNQDAAEMLAASLAALGCRVRIAHDGPAALLIAAAETFDVALLDIGLPVMDGYELGARLAELPHAQGIRLVAVTGYGQASDRARSQAAGFHHHLVKPVDLAALDTVMHDRARSAG
jgi:PAS domain S-box-containing protein